MIYRKKLIEVALPLDAINKESAREKSIRHGHPSTLHLWWSRKPLATCRAVLFASLVDDPGEPDAPQALLEEIDRLPVPERLRPEWEGLTLDEQRRQRLFGHLEELVRWENSGDERVLGTARALILASTGGNPPPVLDPFCGGGSIPLEAQRLGLEAHGSDLNPVAVLITKALVEIPPKFAGLPPVNPESRAGIGGEGNWRGAKGLAEDVRYYGRWMRDEAEKRIGHLYPRGPKGETVIAWLWARTVRCPNPACGARMPLTSKFWLSKKANRKAWVEPVVDREAKEVRFEVREGSGGPSMEGTVNRKGATCVVCETAVPFAHIRAEGQAGRMGQQLMAVVAEGQRGRNYLPPRPEHVAVAEKAEPQGVPDTDLPEQALGFRVQQYGMTRHRDLFTPRQLGALTTFSDLVGEARERARSDAFASGLLEKRAAGYADFVTTYLAFAVDRLADRSSAVCGWDVGYTKIRNTFARQAIPMNWDFAEGNAFSESTGNFVSMVEWVAECVEESPANGNGEAHQRDATDSTNGVWYPLISTDPPYYDNIGYADLSDFFYVWLRRSLGGVYPNIFGTLLVPKSQELVADPHRHGGRKEAQEFFEEGLGQAFEQIREKANPKYPMTVYYAFKQSESQGNGDGTASVASTGWETMLEGLLATGFQLTGTWPMRSELGNRMRNIDSNALASSIVLVCRPRPQDAPTATRREFVNALRRELPGELEKMMTANVAPVDLAQATIGPGMAIYSRYPRVLEADGSPLKVRAALGLINAALDEILASGEGDLDAESRFCLAWFEQYGHREGDFGDADVLARARNTSVAGLQRSGVLHQRGGKVRLLKRDELPGDWDPASDDRVPAWECTQQLVRALVGGEGSGEEAAADLARALGPERSEEARALSYRLYGICDRKGWAEEALAYNALVQQWPAVQGLVARGGAQGTLL